MTNRPNLCLSQDPSCSGVTPCQACFDFLVGGRVNGQMVWPSGGVVPRTMFLAGPPFNADPGAAATFMRAFPQALSDGANFIAQMTAANIAARMVSQAAHVPPVQPLQPEAPPPALRRQVSEEEHLLNFQAQLLESVPRMSEADRLKICQGVANQNLEGWEQLTEGEKAVLQAIFLPPEEVAEEEPLPSNESAAKVVAALRNGTLGPNTLAPPPAPVAAPAQDDTTPAAAAGAAAPEERAPQAPPIAHEAAGQNGTSGTNMGPAQVAEPSQETTPS